MANVVTMNASVECGHSGVVTKSSTKKLTVDSKAVLVKASVNGKSVSATCSNPVDSSGHKKCTTATVTGTEATKLKAGGEAVLLESLTGTTDGNPAGTPKVASGSQSKLTAK